MSDDIMEEDGIQYLREASRLVPLLDARPSICISLLVYDPVSSELHVTWKNGDPGTLDCSREAWISFKFSLGSSGQFVNSLMQRGPGNAPKPASGPKPPSGKNPFPKRF
jgi:hypothetical protein